MRIKKRAWQLMTVKQRLQALQHVAQKNRKSLERLTANKESI